MTARSPGPGAVGPKPGVRSRLRRVAADPEVTTDLLQILKSVIAGTGTWWLAVNVLESPMPFLAPWSALLTVHATVYRSLARGTQTTVASAIGVGVSFLIGHFLGVNVATFALALFVGLLGARIRWFRDEGVAIATTAIFVLGSGFSGQEALLGNRLVEVAVGVAGGVVVNLLLIPPLRDQQAARYVDSINRRMGSVLVDMADELASSWDTDKADAWVVETQSMAEMLNSAWQSVRFARESSQFNPRRRLARRGRRGGHDGEGAGERVDYNEILLRVDEGISHLRHLARTLREATYAGSTWDTWFRRQWVGIVRDAGRVISDPDAEVEPIEDRINALASSSWKDRQPPEDEWPVYGSLITSIRHIAVVVDDVASARAARQAT